MSPSVVSSYDGGFGGKKASLAAMDEVTPPIPLLSDLEIERKREIAVTVAARVGQKKKSF